MSVRGGGFVCTILLCSNVLEKQSGLELKG